MSGRGPDRLDPHGAEQNHLVVGALQAHGSTGGNRLDADTAGAGQFIPFRQTFDGGPDDNAAQAGHLIDPVAFHQTQDPIHGDNFSPALGATSIGMGVHDTSSRFDGVRRLTPVECERLMGWPDGHTERRADGSLIADSHRYRLCGNGVVAPVAAWIGARLSAELAVVDVCPDCWGSGVDRGDRCPTRKGRGR